LLHSGNRDSGFRNSIVSQLFESTGGYNLRHVGNLLPGWQFDTVQYLFEAYGYFTGAIPTGEGGEFTLVNAIQGTFGDGNVLRVGSVIILGRSMNELMEFVAGIDKAPQRIPWT
jgi:hypothetical protein